MLASEDVPRRRALGTVGVGALVCSVLPLGLTVPVGVLMSRVLGAGGGSLGVYSSIAQPCSVMGPFSCTPCWSRYPEGHVPHKAAVGGGPSPCCAGFRRTSLTSECGLGLSSQV